MELGTVPVEPRICRGPVGGVIEACAKERQVDVGGGPVLHPARGRLVIRDLLRFYRVADVEYAEAGLEVTARRKLGVRWIVDRAVVRVVSEPREAFEVRECRVAVCRIVDLQHQLRNDRWVLLV